MNAGQIQRKLEKMLKDKGVRIRYEKISVGHLACRKSSIYQDRYTGAWSRVVVYYWDSDQKVQILAHEVGHMQCPSECQYIGVGILEHEHRASMWALDFLKACKYPRLESARRYYKAAFGRYAAHYGDGTYEKSFSF